MAVEVALSGRCFWGRRTTSNGRLLYTLITQASSERAGSNNIRVPLSLVGNTYYERRFLANTGAKCRRETPLSSSSMLSSLCAGDIVVKMGSATPMSLRGRRIVDVTGIKTSFFDASERNPRARRSIDDVVCSMHLYDGHEVPELNRGVVAVGRLTVLCAFPFAGAVSLVVLENASWALLGLRPLTYKSEDEGIQLVRVIAENCGTAAARRLRLCPIKRGDSVVGVSLQ